MPDSRSGTSLIALDKLRNVNQCKSKCITRRESMCGRLGNVPETFDVVRNILGKNTVYDVLKRINIANEISTYRYAGLNVSVKSNSSVDVEIFYDPKMPGRLLFIFIKVERRLNVHIFNQEIKVQQTFRRRIQSGRSFVFPRTRFCSFLNT